MKRTRKEMFEKRLNAALQLVLTNNGHRINIAKLHYRGAMAKKLFDNVTTMLNMMGVEYKNYPKGSLWIQVPTPTQLNAAKIANHALDAFVAGLDYSRKKQGLSSDMSALSIIRGKMIDTIIIDDAINTP